MSQDIDGFGFYDNELRVAHGQGIQEKDVYSVIFYCQNFANFDYPEDRQLSVHVGCIISIPPLEGVYLIIILAWAVALLILDKRQCEGLDSGISKVDSPRLSISWRSVMAEKCCSTTSARCATARCTISLNNLPCNLTSRQKPSRLSCANTMMIIRKWLTSPCYACKDNLCFRISITFQTSIAE